MVVTGFFIQYFAVELAFRVPTHFGKDSRTETVVAGINQEHLAQMVGTTRSRINHFMNKFRKLGFIAYSADEGLTVHRGLRRVLLHDDG